MKRKLFIPLLILIFNSCIQPTDPLETIENLEWVDLTWSFDEKSVYWPTNIPFRHETVFEGINDKGYFYSSYKYSAEEHGGTHFDAPNHFAQGKNSIEKVPLEQLIGEGILVDVTKKTLKNRDYQISVEDFAEWESQYGLIPENAIILVNTGFGKFYPDLEKYTGTKLTGQMAIEHLHFPGLDPEAAKWLIKMRKIKSFGLDTPSIDYGQSKEFMTHRILFSESLTAYENLSNLDILPPKGFLIIALPMKIKGGSGAPLRIIAGIPKN